MNSKCNYYISDKGLLKKCDKEESVAVPGDCCCFLFEKKTVKRTVQCHVIAQSPPNLHFALLHSQYYLVATVIQIVSAQSCVCVCTHTHILHNTETLVGQNK